MNKINVNKNVLLGRLKENREKHYGVFLKAQEGFKKKVIEELEKRLEDARKGKRINQFLSLPEPIDQTKEYDRAIEMLEMHIGETIELNQNEFACYVQDDWDWKHSVITTNTMYI